MKKKIILVLVLCIMTAMLCGCSASYENAATPTDKDYGGYFSVLKEWHDSMGNCKILYADDTHVMYFYFDGSYTGGITPIYNADGTLQIWEGE